MRLDDLSWALAGGLAPRRDGAVTAGIFLLQSRTVPVLVLMGTWVG